MVPVSRSRAAVQARAYYRRKDRRGRQTGIGRAPISFQLEPGQNDIPTGTLFPLDLREAQVTFSWRMRIENDQARGVVLEFGSREIGCAVWVQDPVPATPAGNLRLGVGCGYRPPFLSPNGDYQFTTQARRIPIGVDVEVVVSFRPGTGSMRGWINGERLIAQDASDGTYQRPGTSENVWADDMIGTFFAEPDPGPAAPGTFSDPGPPPVTGQSASEETGVHGTSPYVMEITNTTPLSPLRVHRCLAPSAFGDGELGPRGGGFGQVDP